ncbi:glycosyltransferase [Shewanella oncorhynchi]|uniref:glycosyltransferase n=1 Tax=Shewanella TaxID=22 RepID=UPI0021D9B3DB|nr:glycosyltransferase [Shewanella sp. SM32]MCU8069540.1 glycosyltransferase [Shewanella sp. SM32]
MKNINQEVTILMATYNGALFIENQILSLLQQTYKNWVLLIHDDGSSDQTINVINKYEAIDSRIRLIKDSIIQQGVGKNFLSLVKHVHTKYAIFCDQDDIWLERKLEEMLNVAEQINLAKLKEPSIVYANGFAFDSDTGVIDFNGISNTHALHLKDFLFFNGGYQGCSILFNQAMMDFIKKYQGPIHHHDDLVSLVAHAFGQVNFLDKKLMLYRQHSNAVTGMKVFNKNPLRNKIDFILSKPHHLVKIYFYDEYKNLLCQSNSIVFKNYLDYATAPFIKRLYISFASGLTLGGSRLKLVLKTILRSKVISS